MKAIWWLKTQLAHYRQPVHRQLHRLDAARDSWEYLRRPTRRSLREWVQMNRAASPASLPPTVQRRRGQQTQIVRPSVAIALSVVTLTTALGQRFFRQPELQVGTVSPKTILAPESATVVDEETTEAQRAAARNGAVPVLIPDEGKNTQIKNSLDSLLSQATMLRRQAGAFPFLPTEQVSTLAQQYIRVADERDWQAVWTLAQPTRSPEGLINQVQGPDLDAVTQRADYRALTPEQQQVVRQLITYQRSQNPQELRALQLQIDTARLAYRQALSSLTLLADAERGLPEDPQLFTLTSTDWEATQQGMRRVLQRMLLQGIVPGMPADLLQVATAAQLQGEVPAPAATIAEVILMAVLEVNLVEDPERTRQKAEAAADRVQTVTVTARQGEPIVETGETIDQGKFVLLDHFELSQRRLNIWGLVGFGVVTTGAVAIFLGVERTVRPALRWQDHTLILCTLVGVSGLSVAGLAVYGLPAVGLLVSSFYGVKLGTTVVALLSLTLPLGTRVSIVPLIASTTGALVCSVIAPRLRSREELALLGGVVGIIQGGTYLVLTWMWTPLSLATWYLPLTGAVVQGIYGVISSVVALGLSPYLEHLFDLVTPIRLAELSNPNRPLLKRLASEAPGTFQHTVFVASLAEAAARALRCNVELVRAGTLYHDIGKMHDPMGFIENQMGGPNKHDEIDDPWVSAEIIKKHVSEGLVMARRCRLPKAIQAFIPEHQGTMLISYFYHQAKERAAKDEAIAVQESDFRYDGPIPQSPETGIVMLADSCEAALRSLKDATPEEALMMVNRILKARWRDNQLIDSGLMREHMTIIAQVFVQVWQQYNHKRIAYPKASTTPVVSTPTV